MSIPEVTMPVLPVGPEVLVAPHLPVSDPEIQAVQRRIDFGSVTRPFRALLEGIGDHSARFTAVLMRALSRKLYVIREVFLYLICKPTFDPHQRSFIELIHGFSANKPALERKIALLNNGFKHMASVRQDLNCLQTLKVDVEQTLQQLITFTAFTEKRQPPLPIHDEMVHLKEEYQRLHVEMETYLTNQAPSILKSFHAIANFFIQPHAPLPDNIREDLYKDWKIVEQAVLPYIPRERLNPDFFALMRQLSVSSQNHSVFSTIGDIDKPLPLRNIGNSCYLDGALQAVFAIDGIRNRLNSPILENKIRCLEQELANGNLPQDVRVGKEALLRHKLASLEKRKAIKSEMTKLMHGGEYMHQRTVSYVDYVLALLYGPSLSKLRKLIFDSGIIAEFRPANLVAQLDAAAALEFLMEDILEYSYGIQRLSSTPAMPGLTFPGRVEYLSTLQIPLANEAVPLSELINRFFGVEISHETDERYQRSFDPKDGVVIDPAAASASEALQTMKVEEYQTFFRLKDLPDVMAIHLKRFDSAHDFIPRKINTPVELPQNGIIDLTPYYDAPIGETLDARYEITSIVTHSGGLHGGHYTADVKRGDQYWHCDDLGPRIEKISKEGFLNNKSAYLIVLKRIQPN